jgi:cation diffusion facilitator family transporter
MENIGIRISKNTILGNAVLSILKVGIGIFARSSAMISDGIHSFSDVISTIGVIIGLKLSNEPEDESHPYGHEKIESLASLFLAMMLFFVAIGIAWSGINTIKSGEYLIPGKMAIVAALLSILGKEWMFFYTIKYAKQLNSPALKADAWHHRSDSLSSIGALVGIVGARMGYPILDPLVALVIAALIIKVSYDIAKQGIEQLIDKSASDEIISEIEERIWSIQGVRKIDILKTRQHANKIYVDVEISVDGELTVKEGHDIALEVHDLIEKNELVKHCMVHVNPEI